MKKFLFLLCLPLILSCQTNKGELERSIEEFRKETYLPILNDFTVADVRYSGFYELFEYRATLFTTPMQKTHRQLKARYNQWDDLELEKSKKEDEESASIETRLFLSFYSPDRKVAELTKKGSSWTIILQNNGKRYVGQIKRSKVPRSELVKFYPFHTRWSRAFAVTFTVPVTAIEKSSSQLIISSSVGSSTKEFKAISH